MRSIKGKWVAGAVGLLLCAVLVGETFAEAPSSQAPLFEELLFPDINVVTAAKREQSLKDAPAAMNVVTAEDIKLSGATQLGEALTMVPGLNIRHSLAGSMHTGGIRGLMKMAMNKNVLLINGMPWDAGTYKDPLFVGIPVSLEDIDRIEIMKGPGSSLYGANAMTGVINVILKKTRDTRGGLASLTAGDYNTLLGTLRYGSSIGSTIDYRVSGYYVQRDNYGTVPFSRNPTQQAPAGNAIMDYRINGNSSLSVWAGAGHASKAEIDYEDSGPIDYGGSDIVFAHVKYAINKPDIVITAYQQDMNFTPGYSFGAPLIAQVVKNDKLEAQNIVDIFTSNKLVWGAALEHNMVDSNPLAGKRYRTQTGVFFDDTYTVSDWLTLNGGARYDKRNDTSEPVYSHRITAMFFPWANHRIRLTEGLSYRNPDFVESYYYARTVVDPSLGLYYDVFGHPDLKPEKADTLEASYSGRIANFGFEVNAYVMNVKDFIFMQTTSVQEPIPGMVIPQQIDFVNGGEAQVSGYEAEVRYLFTRWLSGLANYTYIYQREVTPPLKAYLTQTPQNMANVQLTARFRNRWTVNLSGNYVDSTLWVPYPSWGAGGKADAYTIANLYVGYKLMPNMEISLAVDDLFDLKYDEYPIVNQKIGRRVTGTVTYEF